MSMRSRRRFGCLAVIVALGRVIFDQELTDLFGPYKPQVARSNEQIVRNVHDSRVGREIYSWLILVLAGMLAVEYIVSNWFYKRE